MNPKNRVSTKRRAAAACTLTAVAGAVLALAQTAHAQQAQTVTVTGIRGAIESAISTKKEADTIVEAITSEDLGRLPEPSVADAMARAVEP